MKIEDSIRDVRPFAATRPAIHKMADGFLSVIVEKTEQYLARMSHSAA
jgi:hypothetical protein